ncbi:MAG: hypothetical protein E6H07_04575 [Bacteroidetes bacterium]|nr:MAG: hypothetical protein E6H07_04575 [Bacteroidota bacterium]
MEVHAHTHTPRKKWTHYFWEFFMLFLAVFCGFLAEYQLEHKIEKDRAKELAESLYEEVYADSVTMQNKINMRLQKEERMQYFRNYVSDSDLTKLSEKFYPSFAWTAVLTTSIIFEPNDGILSQLRNSGALRYFKSTRLQNSISHINVAISNARERNIQEYHFIEQFVRPFTLKHYDFKWMDDYTQNGKQSILQSLAQTNYHTSVTPIIKNIQDFKREDAEGLVAYYQLVLRATRQIHYQAYIERNHELLQTLRAEYGFKIE